MPQLKSLIFTAIFCLLLCTADIYALGPNELNLEKQETAFSLDVIVKPLDGVINGLGKSIDGTASGLGDFLGGTINGLGKSLGGTINGLGKSLDGTMKGLGESFDGTMIGLGNFLEDTGEIAEEIAKVAIVVGVVILYITAEANFYYPGYSHHYGYDHCYHRW